MFNRKSNFQSTINCWKIGIPDVDELVLTLLSAASVKFSITVEHRKQSHLVYNQTYR